MVRAHAGEERGFDIFGFCSFSFCVGVYARGVGVGPVPFFFVSFWIGLDLYRFELGVRSVLWPGESRGSRRQGRGV